MSKIKQSLFLVIAVSCFSVYGQTQSGGPDVTRSAGPPPDDVPKAQVEQVAEGVFQIGKVILDHKKGTVSIPAKINQREGLIELLLCTEWGRVHESVFITPAYPIYLQTALLLLGLQYGAPVKISGGTDLPKGDETEITVSWLDNGAEKKYRIEEFAYDKQHKRSMKQVGWIYTGSQFSGDVFYAQAEGSIITTYRDPNTMFDNPLPEGADDTVYYANSELIPPVGTDVTITFKKSTKTDE